MSVSRRQLLSAGAALPVLTIGACQMPGSGPPPREFRVTPKTTFPEDLTKVDWSLVVDRPEIERAIDDARIARMSGVQIEYYANATWVDRPATMIEPLLIQSFRNSGAIEVVADRRSDVRPDFVLNTKIVSFQAEPADGGTQARVTMGASLMAMPKREVVGTTEIGRTVAAADTKMQSIAAAFDDALGKVLKRVVEWTLETGNKAQGVS